MPNSTGLPVFSDVGEARIEKEVYLHVTTGPLLDMINLESEN
jgi:hypothetical protein